ncbi:YHS domain protein [Pseudodesulfovibrio mercurii]|uniref:YHS domain protein n=1 Tax=Pseudodesulfovibrio mercurii TaxID=641491 RepID=F0JGV4_9BACT|nr:YHS domain-containing protein [Pseudodesulfovibrio mercurii]EGB15144.1 YHS domain protein [Pseudodesulfovibrio mercurii]
MKRTTWTIVAFVLIACIASVMPWAAGRLHAEPGNQTSCPVMGFDINRDIFTDYKAKRIYFCCPSCPPEFRKKPDFYIAAMQAKGVLPEDAPVEAF